MNIFIAGDSTAAQKETDKRPETGWGEKIPFFFAETVCFYNYALNGRSSKSFIDEGHLAKIAAHIAKDDVLLIQFAHNDEKDDPARHTDPDTTFPAYLSQYIDTALRAGACPMLLTPLPRRLFSVSGQLQDTHERYSQSVRKVAFERKIPLLDVESRLSTLFGEMGDSLSKKYFLWLDEGVNPNYPNGIRDNTHLSDEGAFFVASIIADLIQSIPRNQNFVPYAAILQKLVSFYLKN